MRPDLSHVPEPQNDYSDQYIPTADQLRQQYEVTIQFFTSGCVVRVGCKSIAFTDPLAAMAELTDYVKDPAASYKKWSKALDLN